MDTVAIETVNYFGISTEQPHSLNIIHSFELPFEGILELYVLFYDSLTCTFEVTIPDTITSSAENFKFEELRIFPNPVADQLHIEFSNLETLYDLNLRIFNSLGQEKINYRLISPGIQIPAGLIGESGLYFIQISDSSCNIIETRKLLLK
jgi:hypothetical protein